jgi:hypothetical protein
MTESDSIDDQFDPAGPSTGTERPQFRLISADSVDDGSPDETVAKASKSRWVEVSKYLLINGNPWMSRWSKAPEGYVRAKASIPLVASLARIRSRSDAALALTMVIETLYVDFHVQLPCGALDDAEIAFLLPESCDPEVVAEAIDRSLETQVRATDLQGGMRDRAKSRVCSI